MKKQPIDELHTLNLIDLVVEARSNSEDDLAFARRIALACAELADRARKSDRDAGAVIKGAFALD